MNILMFGGTGIISSEICKFAISKGDIVNIFNRGHRMSEVTHGVNLIVGDLRKDSIQSISSKLINEYDVIIDFISYTPNQLRKTLDISKNRCKHFVFLSSATVYTNQVNTVYDESSPIGNSNWKYSQDKVDCEKLLENSFMNFDYTIVRPYITYGHTRIPYQIAPLEYYTIINRIKSHKPILICNENTKCTLTSASDFALGLYPLLLNHESYGQAINIIGGYQTTWGKVIRYIASYLDIEIKLIDVPLKWIISNKNHAGFDIDEIIGDKGRDMLFDNNKIKKLVPEFKDFKSFEFCFEEIIDFFDKDKNKNVNYFWDAGVDRLLEKYLKDIKVSYDKSTLSIDAYTNDLSDDDRMMYFSNRSLKGVYKFKIKRKLTNILRK